MASWLIAVIGVVYLVVSVDLLIGTQWEKFLDPNYGQVPEPIQYSQPSSLSYNDLMGILGSKQGYPAKSSLSITRMWLL